MSDFFLFHGIHRDRAILICPKSGIPGQSRGPGTENKIPSGNSRTYLISPSLEISPGSGSPPVDGKGPLHHPREFAYCCWVDGRSMTHSRTRTLGQTSTCPNHLVFEQRAQDLQNSAIASSHSLSNRAATNRWGLRAVDATSSSSPWIAKQSTL